jgi:dTDP-4-dehydrorhamnose reductase
MTMLVIGASGLVGGALLQALAEAGEEAVGTAFGHPRAGLLPLDLRDARAVRDCIARSGARVVYLPASLTHVDYCETHPDESYAVNVAGVRLVAECGIRIVYFSSDYVFAGDRGPYAESDPVKPISVYGRHKVLAEQSLPPGALIIRTTVVYGWEVQEKNFVYRLIATLRDGKTLRAPADQIGSPTFAPNLARAAVALERRGATGVYHVAGPERASRHAFAVEAARVFGLDPSLVEPVSTEALAQPAARPLDAGMVCDKAQANLPFPLIGYREGLRLFSQAIEQRPHGAQGRTANVS